MALRPREVRTANRPKPVMAMLSSATSPTVTTVDPEIEAYVAVTVLVPSVNALRTPTELTLATAVFDDCQVATDDTLLVVASVSVAVATNA